jgi:hypothetical protein
MLGHFWGNQVYKSLLKDISHDGFAQKRIKRTVALRTFDARAPPLKCFYELEEALVAKGVPAIDESMSKSKQSVTEGAGEMGGDLLRTNFCLNHLFRTS